MPSGKAPTGERRAVADLLSRRWSARRSLPGGIVSLLTVVFWAIWLYLVLPLVSLLLWVLGVRLFLTELREGGYEGLRTSLVAYSSVLLVLVGLLALWIGWNVARYGGRNDRRTIKRADVTDREVSAAFQLDGSVLALLRGERRMRVDLDGDDRVVVIAPEPPPASAAGAEQRAPRVAPREAELAQRDRGSTRSG